MARQRTLLAISILILLTLSLGAKPIEAQNISLPMLVLAIQSTQPVSRSIDLSGTASISQPLTVGSVLEVNDVVDVPSGGQVVIICGDSYETITKPIAPQCVSDSPLQPGNNIFLWGKVSIQGAFRSGIIPEIITPGNSLVLDPPTEITWIYDDKDVSSVTYSAEVDDPNNLNLWSGSDISSTEVEIPSDKKLVMPDLASMQSGASYEVIVTATGKSNGSDVTTTGSAVFCYANDQVRQLLTDASNIMNGVSLPSWASSSLDYVRAHLYYHEGLYSDAFQLLNKMLPTPLNQSISPGSASPTQIPYSPAFYVLLGDTQLAMGVRSQAILAYNRAQELAVELQDQLTLAAVKVRLGDTLKGFDDPTTMPDTTKQYYTDAETIYKNIGFQDKAAEVAQWSQKQFNPNDYSSICGEYGP